LLLLLPLFLSSSREHRLPAFLLLSSALHKPFRLTPTAATAATTHGNTSYASTREREVQPKTMKIHTNTLTLRLSAMVGIFLFTEQLDVQRFL
jgi:hypothetical protein